MDDMPDISFKIPLHIFQNVELPEPDRSFQDIRKQFSADVRASFQKYLQGLERIPRPVYNLQSLTIFMETALKILRSNVVYYKEMAMESLQLLSELENEVPQVLDAVGIQICDAAPQGTLPPEKCIALFPCIRGAMDLILKHVSEQILILMEHQSKVHNNMLRLQCDVELSLQRSYENAKQILDPTTIHDYGAIIIRNSLNSNTRSMYIAIDQNRSLLRRIHGRFQQQSISADIFVITARKMIQTARETAASCLGLLGIEQVKSLIQAADNAMSFAKRSHLFAAQYTMDKAIDRLFHTLDILESVNTPTRTINHS